MYLVAFSRCPFFEVPQSIADEVGERYSCCELGGGMTNWSTPATATWDEWGVEEHNTGKLDMNSFKFFQVPSPYVLSSTSAHSLTVVRATWLATASGRRRPKYGYAPCWQSSTSPSHWHRTSLAGMLAFSQYLQISRDCTSLVLWGSWTSWR